MKANAKFINTEKIEGRVYSTGSKRKFKESWY